MVKRQWDVNNNKLKYLAKEIEVQIEVLGVVNEQICQQQADTGFNI